jgi:hypothetical protein
MVVGMAEAGQRCEEPLHEEEEGRPHPGRFGRADRTPPRAGWTFSGACGSVQGLFGTCGRLQEPQGGQRFASWMLILPKKGPTSPSEGPDVSLLAHILTFLAFNV